MLQEKTKKGKGKQNQSQTFLLVMWAAILMPIPYLKQTGSCLNILQA